MVKIARDLGFGQKWAMCHSNIILIFREGGRVIFKESGFPLSLITL